MMELLALFFFGALFFAIPGLVTAICMVRGSRRPRGFDVLQE